MRKFLMITHGQFAQGIQQSLSLFLGDDHPFHAISAYLDDTPVQPLIDAFMLTIEEADELIILTDIMGGSVNQLMLPYLQRKHTFIITGFNFPLLLELSVLPNEYLTEHQLDQIVEQLRSSIQVVHFDHLQLQVNSDDE